MKEKGREHHESAGKRHSEDPDRSGGSERRATGGMSAGEMLKMMAGMTAEDMSKMMQGCCPDGADCDYCDWMIRRMFADSQEEQED